jgi:hypothetical protein
MASKQINEFNISGKVLYVGMPIFFTDNMSKRLLVMEVWVNSKYKQEVPFDFVNENMDMVNNIREGDWVTVDFILRGRKKIRGDGKAQWWSNNEGISCVKED